MTNTNKYKLLDLLDEYYQELTKTCNYDCYNCDIGMLPDYGYIQSCPIETITRKLYEEVV